MMYRAVLFRAVLCCAVLLLDVSLQSIREVLRNTGAPSRKPFCK